MSTSHTDPRQRPPASGPEGRRRQLARVPRRKRRLRAGLVQLLAAAVAVGLGFLLPQAHIGYDIPVSEAVSMLVAVGAATVTFIGVVFSLLFLVVQFRVDHVHAAAQPVPGRADRMARRPRSSAPPPVRRCRGP